MKKAKVLMVFFLVLGIGLLIFPGQKKIKTGTVSPSSVIIDDYQGVSLPGREWYYTRIGTDRGVMGDGSFTTSLGGGSASATVSSGWAGVWTSLVHNAAENDDLNPRQLLGPFINGAYQPYISGIEVDIIDGLGQFKIELKDKNNNFIGQTVYTLTGGQRTLQYLVAPTSNISKLNWLVDGAGSAEVDEVRFLISSPSYSLAEAVFLFSYGHLSQCYDAGSGLVRDRSAWPVADYAAVPSMGIFALATAMAWDLGYVEEATARSIVQQIKTTLLGLPRHEKGLWPHFLKNGAIAPNTEWSSVDTAITLVSAIEAGQAMGEDTSALENILKTIDWADLTANGTLSIGMGYDYSGAKLTARWDTFGAEAFLIAVAYSAATGDNQVKLDLYDYPPTWDGSGFNDELANLFFPMTGTDTWGNDWAAYRAEAFDEQSDYFSGKGYAADGLFGLSASEVPEPWMVAEADVYKAWGVGGHNGQANDGTATVGYPVIAPHYAAMIGAEHPERFQALFNDLLVSQAIFTPLNNVESFGLDSGAALHWNALKGSWNLGLQTLGAGRALSGGDYLPYRTLKTEGAFLVRGFDKIMPVSLSLTLPNGGESWVLGSTVHITWKASRLIRKLKITLWKGNSLIGTIASNIDSSLGDYAWVVGETTGKIVRPGDNYTIKIKEQGGPRHDQSDAPFAISE